MARSTMTWIINELRRKVFDYGPQTLDDTVYMAGDTIQLKAQFYNLASTAVTPTSPRVNVYSPLGTTVVNSATTSPTATTGVQIYNYKIATNAIQGIYRVDFTGKVLNVTSAYTTEFEIRKTQRIWTDDELQNYLDRSRIFVGVNNARELLQRSADYKRYISNFDTWEWATLYDSPDNTANTITPTASNLVVGEWTFTTAQTTDLYVEGHCYNTYAASAECLEELAGDPSRSSSWNRGGISHKSQDPLQLAFYYRRLAHGGRSVQLVRTYY